MQQFFYSVMYRVEASHWWYVGRRRILEDFLRTIVADPGMRDRRLRILDVGCGTGANLEMLSQFGEPEGIDLSKEALAFCEARGLTNVRQGGAERLPYADDSFDIVTALDVLEHLENDAGAMAEIHRVLKPGGKGLFFVPAFLFLWGHQDEVSNHLRRYTLDQMRSLVQGAGLCLKRGSYANFAFFLPTLLGRTLMRVTGWRPESEAEITLGPLNRTLGRILGAEASLLRHFDLPFGVSIVCLAHKQGIAQPGQ